MRCPSASNQYWRRYAGIDLSAEYDPSAVSEELAGRICEAFGLFATPERCIAPLPRARAEVGLRHAFLFPTHSCQLHRPGSVAARQTAHERHHLRCTDLHGFRHAVGEHRDEELAHVLGVARDQLQDLAERNPPIRLITRIAFGFKSPDALIALAMLSLGGHKPALPTGINPRIWQESAVSCVFLRLQFVNRLVSGDAGDDFLGCRQRLGGELPDTSVSHAM